MRAGTEISRFALNVLDKKVTFLRGLKVKDHSDFVTMADEHVDQLKAAIEQHGERLVKSSQLNKHYQALIRLIINTGCRPSEALKALSKDYWSISENGWPTFCIPGYDTKGIKATKTGFDHKWVF